MKEDKKCLCKEAKRDILKQMKDSFELTYEDIAYLLGVSEETLHHWNDEFYSLIKQKLIISESSREVSSVQVDDMKEHKEFHYMTNTLMREKYNDKLTGKWNNNGDFHTVNDFCFIKQNRTCAIIQIHLKKSESSMNSAQAIYSHNEMIHLMQYLNAECREGEFCAQLAENILLFVITYDENIELDKRLQALIETLSNNFCFDCNRNKLYVEFGVYLANNNYDESLIKMIEKASFAMKYNDVAGSGNRIVYYQKRTQDAHA